MEQTFIPPGFDEKNAPTASLTEQLICQGEAMAEMLNLKTGNPHIRRVFAMDMALAHIYTMNALRDALPAN